MFCMVLLTQNYNVGHKLVHLMPPLERHLTRGRYAFRNPHTNAQRVPMNSHMVSRGGDRGACCVRADGEDPNMILLLHMRQQFV